MRKKENYGPWILKGEGPCSGDEGMTEGGKSHVVRLIPLQLFFLFFLSLSLVQPSQTWPCALLVLRLRKQRRYKECHGGTGAKQLGKPIIGAT